MSNPAQDLAAILRGWSIQPKGQSIRASRGGRGNHDLRFIQSQVRAGGLLGDVQRAIQRLEAAGENVDHFNEFLPQWWDAVVLPAEAWNTTTPGERRVIPAATIATLSAFAAYLDKSDVRAFTPTQDSLVQARQALADLVDLLSESELPLNEQARAYVFALITELRTIFDSAEAKVDIDVIRRIHELQGYLGSVAHSLEDADADNPLALRLRKLSRMVAPIAIPVFGALGYLIGATADSLAITDSISDK